MPVQAWARRTAIGFALLGVILIGAALRFQRLDEMEYKEDERWTYEHVVGVPARQPWPLVGMRSSIGLPNPALSVLVFIGLAHTVPIESPVDLAARVAALNVAALALVFIFGALLVAPSEREAWWWGGALAAVSPFAVLLERKIWAQSTLPFFSMLFLIGWWRRERWWGALLWGLLTACLGQIHMSGLFFAAAFVLSDLYGEPQRQTQHPTAWRWFFVGFVPGAVGLVHWIAELAIALASWITGVTGLTERAAVTQASPVQLAGVLDLHVLSFWPSYWVNWISDAAGFGLDYSLGPHYWTFLHGPIVSGRSTWLALAATAVSVAVAATAATPWAFALVADLRSGRWRTRVRHLGETAFTEAAALAVFGLLLTATLLKVHRHYLIVAYPLQWIWLSRLLLRRRRGRALLAALWVAQLVLTLGYLGYIHAHHGAEGGDYGRGFKWQQEGSKEPGL
jgi:hypothetical protein